MTKPIILIDGSSYFFRAFHALPSLTTSKGQATGAIYGVVNMVKRLIKDYQPTQIAVVFDAEGKTFRDDLYPAYKMQRSIIPDKLGEQFAPLKQLLIAMGLPVIIISGVEADDVIGTLAKLAVAEGMSVLISTGDKDLAQLVNNHVTLINTMSNQVLDPVGVKKKFGVTPAQIIDYLTLVGDHIDNVPGVNLCGPKTAEKWLQQYHTLDNLIANMHELGGKVGQSLRDSTSNIPLYKTLLTIKTDVDLPIKLADLTIKLPDHLQLVSIAKELEFKTWLKELLAHTPPALANHKDISPPKTINYETVETVEQLHKLCQQLQINKLWCFSIATTSLDIRQAELVGLAFAITENHPLVYIPLLDLKDDRQLTKPMVLTALTPILSEPTIAKIGHNLKYTYNVLKNYNINLQGIAFDTMLEAYVLDSSGNQQDTQMLALKYLGQDKTSYAEIAGKGAKQLQITAVKAENIASYLAEDADINLKLHHKLYGLLAEPLQKILKEIEMLLLTVLANLEYQGVLIDQNILAQHGLRLKEQMTVLSKEIMALTSQDFNLNSPKQLQEVLFVQQKLPILAKTATGQPSTAEAILQELSYEYRLPAAILEYRSLNKLVSTYIDALPKCISTRTKRVHTSYNQAVTATGRLSSSNPNLQNIPIRTTEGRLIRKAFIAPPNHVLLAADYSQIELRIMAHLSQDENLVKAFNCDWDIHAATASEVFQIDLTAVSVEHRRRAKAINFGLIYGMSAFGLAKQLGIAKENAQHYINSYFNRYPGVLKYMQNTRAQAHINGYVETLFGRRLTLPEINAHNLVRRSAAERAAINAPLQGTAADIIKKAMLTIANWQNTSRLPVKMIMQVHDELVFEVPKNHIAAVTQAITELMENVVQLIVPLRITTGSGYDWEAAH